MTENNHDYAGAEGVLRGRVWWAQVHKPSTYGKYEICVEVDSDGMKALAAQGVADRVKNGDDTIADGGQFIRVKLDAVTAAGVENSIEVVDAQAQPFDALIGNGSLCNVAFRTYLPKAPHDSRRTIRLKGVQVLDLVRYESENDEVSFKVEADYVTNDDGDSEPAILELDD